MMDFLRKALPWIGAAATGNVPALVGMAAKEVSDALGVPVEPTGEAVAKAVAGANPEQLARLQDREMTFKERMQGMGYQHVQEMARLDNAAATSHTDRVGQLEGTASDLKCIPFLGAVMLFLRGSQRPAFGFGTLYADYMVFAGAWTLKAGPVENTFFLVNILVLGFLFGERAVQNMAPFITQMLKASGQKGARG